MSFSLRELDVAEKLAYVFFLFEGILCLETKNMVLVPLIGLDERRDLLPPCANRKNSLLLRFPKLLCRGRSGEFGGMIWILWTR